MDFLRPAAPRTPIVFAHEEEEELHGEVRLMLSPALQSMAARSDTPPAPSPMPFTEPRPAVMSDIFATPDVEKAAFKEHMADLELQSRAQALPVQRSWWWPF